MIVAVGPLRLDIPVSSTAKYESESFAVTAGQLCFVGVLRGNTIRGNTTRNSEKKMAL